MDERAHSRYKVGMNLVRRVLFVLLAVGLVGTALKTEAAARPVLHPLFSDHMVFQREREAPVWGWTTPGAQVIVSLAHQMALATADDEGRWEVKLGPFNAGGPYELKVSGPQNRTLKNVMIGDVWLCSGQSNMEWPVRLSNNSEREIEAAKHPHIRLFTVPKKIAPAPESTMDAAWEVCSPITVAEFSAVGYFFGRQLHEDLDVPIGLIDSSWGGTIAEAWTSAGALNTLADFRDAVTEVQEWAEEANASQVAYDEKVRDWWLDSDPGSQTGAKWSDTEQDDSRWPEMALPGYWESDALPEFDGIVWFRKSFTVPKRWQGDDLLLHLGKIDDADTTFVNGRQVGSGNLWNQERQYRIPSSLISDGENMIAIRVLDTGGNGGVYGAPNDLYLKSADSTKVGAQPLSGWWKYQIAAAKKDLKPFPARRGTSPNVATVLYNGMIAPLLPYGIRGATWYQGESNASRPTQYRTLLPTMIEDWRQQFGAGDFPFLIVQLANFYERDPNPSNPTWAALREAQALTAENDPQTGLAVTIDIGEAGDIHPRNKQDVGKRLALSAHEIAYGKDVVSSGPRFRGMTVSGRAAVLSFDSVGSGLVAKGGGPLEGFSIAGADGEFVWAEASIIGDQVLASSPSVTEPARVRYAWANNPACNLYNREGLPAIPFRTDVESVQAPAGFESLFDGKTLTGFKQINGTADYEVVNGAILGTTSKGSPNSFLCTEKRYGDFELQFEVKLLNPELNSGVQIRSNSYPNYRNGRVHGYQVEISSNGNAGFIYDEARRGWLSEDRSDARARAAFDSSTWNHYRILCVGDRLRTWVNGMPVADVTDSLTSEGFIGLQVHGVRADPCWQVAWRNLWIREIKEDRSEAIFDGKTLRGWNGKPNGWFVDDEGNLARNPSAGYLWTNEVYSDFVLSAEFKVSEGCNSGIFFRTDPNNPVQGGFEIQVLDSYGKSEIGTHDSGALYDAVAPRINAARPAGEWNHCVIQAMGSQVKVRLNGEEVVSANLEEWTQGNRNPDGSRNKFKTALSQLPRTGHIGLQDHGQPVWFRNLRVERLDH